MGWFDHSSAATAMLSLSPATRVFLALRPIDGRKGFNGLYSLVKETLQQEPTSGFLFVFLNKRRNRLKILTYDGSGLWMLTKRLDRGTYAAPVGEGQSLNLRPEDLMLLIHGIEGASRRKWHRV
jgi:transposase